MKTHQQEFSVERMCKVFKISRSAYYRWCKRRATGSESARQKQDAMLGEQITAIYFAHKQRYGSPRITAALKAQGIQASRPKVAKMMRQLGLRSKLAKKYVPTTTDTHHDQPISPNLLARNFQTSGSGKVWVSDITYLVIEEGFLYLTVILDLYDRKVIGWSLSETLRTEDTVLKAWYRAVANRSIQKDFIFHSDRGVQYASRAFRNVLKAYETKVYKIKQSMSRKANCYDNAVAESFFKSLKTEAIYGHKIQNKKQMKAGIFEYIEIWYNRQRRHSYLGYKTILEVENQTRSNY